MIFLWGVGDEFGEDAGGGGINDDIISTEFAIDTETPGFSVFDDDFLHGGMVMDVGRGDPGLLRFR